MFLGLLIIGVLISLTLFVLGKKFINEEMITKRKRLEIIDSLFLDIDHDRLLKVGVHGRETLQLQKLISYELQKKQSKTNVSLDGIFGGGTKKALEEVMGVESVTLSDFINFIQ